MLTMASDVPCPMPWSAIERGTIVTSEPVADELAEEAHVGGLEGDAGGEPGRVAGLLDVAAQSGASCQGDERLAPKLLDATRFVQRPRDDPAT